jgi:hypothetical protein
VLLLCQQALQQNPQELLAALVDGQHPWGTAQVAAVALTLTEGWWGVAPADEGQTCCCFCCCCRCCRCWWQLPVGQRLPLVCLLLLPAGRMHH